MNDARGPFEYYSDGHIEEIPDEAGLYEHGGDLVVFDGNKWYQQDYWIETHPGNLMYLPLRRFADLPASFNSTQ